MVPLLSEGGVPPFGGRIFPFGKWVSSPEFEPGSFGSFSLELYQLDQVDVFNYLGKLLACDDNDNQAMRSNLKKAWRCWAQISHVWQAENASPRVCRMFYKGTVQAVVLFGS